MDFEQARKDFDALARASYPTDLYAADPALRLLNRRGITTDSARLDALERDATAFGREVVSVVGPAAQRYEHRDHLPELQRYDADGRAVEAVRFDPSYHEAGRAVWASGVVAHSGTPGRAFEQATLLYLVSTEGEAGHTCPATCTIGLARALRRRGGDAVREQFLPSLLERDYDTVERGSQFLTEVQGGSDVGANASVAEALGDGRYRITGEKWFCSVADADQFLLTARALDGVPGTKGLGCFVMPREIDGHPNGFRIRRLKDKLGTRGLASGEIDLDGAIAWPIGPVEEGFKTAVGVVLNTSRWATAIGSTGIMRRAFLEAAGFARARTAFGNPIAQFPLVRALVARMKAEWLGALHATWMLTALEDSIDSGDADDDAVLLHRFLVNANKFHASIEATAVVRDGIEVFGGNGTIEEFSVLPRLYRDAIVYESWEGTHNVLVAQVLNDMRRLDLVRVVEARLTSMLDAASTGDGAAAAIARTALDSALAGSRRSIDDPLHGAAHFRTYLARLMVVTQVAMLLETASGGDEIAAELVAAADLLAAHASTLATAPRTMKISPRASSPCWAPTSPAEHLTPATAVAPTSPPSHPRGHRGHRGHRDGSLARTRRGRNDPSRDPQSARAPRWVTSAHPSRQKRPISGCRECDPGQARASRYFARSRCLATLPLSPRASTSTKSTRRGHLKCARCARHHSISSAARASPASASGFASTTASTLSPQSSSGTPITAASATAGCARSTASTSAG